MFNFTVLTFAFATKQPNYLKMKKLTTKEKLNLVLKLTKEHNISSYQIGKNTTLDPSAVHRILTEEVKRPRDRTLTEILEYIESAIVGTQLGTKEEAYVYQRKSPAVISKHQGAPYYDVDFIGGFDLVFNEQSIKPSFYIDYPPYNDADAWINVTGKSMSPFISHGDIAAIKRIESWKDFLPFGEIYAVITDEHRTIKIVTQGKDEDHFTLVPYNKSKEFVEQQIPKKLINNVYRVKGTIKKFF